MIRTLVFAPLLAVLIAFIATPRLAGADATITGQAVENGYPTAITFTMQATADQDIVDVTLRYSLIGRGASALGKPDVFNPDPQIDVRVEVEVNSGNAYIPVGSEFRYSWELVLADGSTTTSEESTFLYLPPDQDWQSVENDIMRVYYHGDRDGTARTYLEAGLETYQQIAVNLLDTELPVVPVKVILFADEAEMDPARQGRGGTFDAAVTTCGTKLTSDIVFVIPVSCGTRDITDTLRHEFAHIITEAAGEGALGRLPSWLDEGTAVIAQSEPGDNFIGAFETAVRGDRLIPFAQMGAPSNDPGQVNLFYGQSWAMASFLVEEGGPASFAELFALIKSGERFDEAINQVYGLEFSAFEDAFRQTQGLAPASAPNPTQAPTQPAQQADPTPTVAPTRAPITTTRETGGDDGIDRSVFIFVGIAALFALAAVALYLVAQMLSAGRSQSAPLSPPPPAAGDDWTRPLPPPPPATSADRPPPRYESEGEGRETD